LSPCDFCGAGTGGATIKATEAATGARFAIQDSGVVHIYAPEDLAGAEGAVLAATGGNIQVRSAVPRL